ncbi:hypothetical protein LF887_04505 [Chryseobacterium sp. MEBOG06]|uniref:hypothetical protein n=1 Tax=Chryseobacterium sp. MEBOG06 TaxID=2879938 RepID=UPI001F2E1BC7|nr:hypothetical protein [Chryseobacterium sp. MEBOG06]UKB84897.1 hypothetical protein LF887_04505 [Chryseobacterium sp. MEBOG06]
MNITIGSVVEIILVLIIGLWMAARSKPKYSVYNRSKYSLTPKGSFIYCSLEKQPLNNI